MPDGFKLRSNACKLTNQTSLRACNDNGEKTLPISFSPFLSNPQPTFFTSTFFYQNNEQIRRYRKGADAGSSRSVFSRGRRRRTPHFESLLPKTLESIESFLLQTILNSLCHPRNPHTPRAHPLGHRSCSTMAANFCILERR